MKQGGIKPPPFKNAAHHIVAAGAAAAKATREIIEKYGVDVNDAINGVFLPIGENISKAANHLTLHTQKYYDTVNEIINQVQNKEELVKVLKGIAEALQQGKFPY